MPSVSLPGGNNSQPVTVTFTSADTAAAAQTLVNAIGTGLQNGTVTPVTFTGAPLPTQSNAALFLDATASGASLTLPPGYNTLVNTATGQVVVVGTAGAQQQIVSGNGGIAYYFNNASSGNVVAGDGPNYITDVNPATGAVQPSGGIRNVVVGSGINTIALQTGRNVVTTGSGTNAVALGSSTSEVYASQSGGQNTIFGQVNLPVSAPGPTGAASAGNDTVHAGSGAMSVYGGYSDFTFLGGTGSATVQGVAGSDTVFANGSTGLFVAGTGGNSLILGGNTSATQVGTSTDASGFHVTNGQVLVGVANGDQLVAATNGAEWLQAGAGNETLNGASSTANNTYYTGQNATVNGGTFYAVTQVATGSGNSTVMGSSGASTVTAGPGATSYEFVQGRAGGNMTITDFNPAKDAVRLYGYASGAAQAATAGAQVTSSGTVVTLSDNTKITFLGYTGGFNGNNFG